MTAPGPVLTPTDPRPITGARPNSWVDQGLARSGAIIDVSLRTALGTALGAVPMLVRGAPSPREAAHLSFYGDLARQHDVASTFVTPPQAEVEVQSVPSATRSPHGPAERDLLRFQSTFEPRNPALDPTRWPDHPNRTVHAEHWRHDDQLRPTIVVLHGFVLSAPGFNSAFLSLRWFYDHGYDVVLLTLPFHGARSSGRSVSGAEIFTSGIAGVNEALLQAVSDVRSLFTHLEGRDAPAVGVTGVSMGGYIAATLAAIEDRLAFSIPIAPLVDPGRLIRQWGPTGTAIDLALKARGRSLDQLGRALAVSSPVNYPLRISNDRVFVVGGLGDRITPPEQAQQLWEHWGRCRCHWHHGTHLLHPQRGDYLREIGRFLRSIDGFDSMPPSRP